MIRQPVAGAIAYFLVWLGLLALLALTVGSAYLSLGWMNSVINIAIAVAKALLVLIFFMHLRTSDPALRVFAAAGFFWLAILLTLPLTDFLMR
jgi:cytochrome c oxidase subunit IV